MGFTKLSTCQSGCRSCHNAERREVGREENEKKHRKGPGQWIAAILP